MKVTKWFNPTQKPVRVGLYQRRHRHFGFVVYAWWDGEAWLLGHPTQTPALQETAISKNQLTAFYWRGVHEQSAVS